MLKDYNPKLDYLVAKYTCKNIPIWEIEETTIKEIYQGFRLPSNDIEMKIIRIKKCLELMKKQETMKISIIEQCYLLLCNNKSYEYNQNLLNKYLDNKNEKEIFINILKNKIFEKYNFEMAVLIFNYSRLIKNKVPVAIIYCKREELNKSLEQCDNKEIDKIIDDCIYKSLVLNVKHKKISSGKIIKQIINNKEYMKNEYGVTSFYLYGSFAKSSATEYSDIDVYIEVNDIYKNKINNKYKLFNYLNIITGLPVDGHVKDIEFNINQMTKDMLRTLIKIL